MHYNFYLQDCTSSLNDCVAIALKKMVTLSALELSQDNPENQYCCATNGDSITGTEEVLKCFFAAAIFFFRRSYLFTCRAWILRASSCWIVLAMLPFISCRTEYRPSNSSSSSLMALEEFTWEEDWKCCLHWKQCQETEGHTIPYTRFAMTTGCLVTASQLIKKGKNIRNDLTVS